MNRFTSLASLSLIGIAALLAGCPKKPVRPTPLDTMSKQGTDMVGGQGLDGGALGNDPALEPRAAGSPWSEADLDRAQFAANTVYFDFDRSAIKQSERTKLQEVAKYLAANPTKRIGLEGHCDWRGTEEYNLGLGDRRANEVKNFLKSLGVDEARMEIASKGDLGAKENGGETEMAKDRRVDVVLFKR